MSIVAPPQYPASVYKLANLAIKMIDGEFEVNRRVLHNNIAELLRASNKYGLNQNETAYVLATAFGETRFGAQMSPGYFDDLVENISYQKAEADYGYESTRGEALGNTDEGDGWLYRGRGFVQLTGRKNYQTMQDTFGADYGIDIVDNPDVVAENSALAADMAVYGMVNGSFSGYSFADAAETEDFFYNSRRIINGVTGAYRYKRHAQQFHTVLETSIQWQ